MKTIVSLVAFLASATAAFSQDCTPKHEFKTVKPGVLTVAVVTYLPYAAIGADGKPMGVDGDIANELAKRECLKVEAVPVDSAAALNYVVSGKADLTAGGYYRTAARAKVVNLTDPLWVDQMGIVSKDGVHDFKSLEGKAIGTVQGDLWVSDLKKVYGGDLKLYPALAQIVQDFEAGRLDAILLSYSAGTNVQQSGQLKGAQIKVADADERIAASVNAGQGTLPMSKKNEAMTTAINANIADMHKDGTIKDILVKYKLDPSAEQTGDPRLIQ